MGVGKRLLGLFLLLCPVACPAPTLDEVFPPNIAQLIVWERQANPLLRSAQDRAVGVEQIPYFRIPEQFFAAKQAERLPAKLLSAFSFEDGQGGRLYPVHPDDTEFFREVQDALKGIEGGKYAELQKSDALVGARTASRSLIVKAKNGEIFSVKASTNLTPGWSQNKPVPAWRANDILGISRLMGKIQPTTKDSNLVLLRDPLLLQVTAPRSNSKPVNEAVLIRPLDGLKADPNLFYLPGFSVFTEAGDAIARANGSAPEAFWKKHFAGPMGKAMADLLVNYGLVSDSPHMQNFLVEMRKENGILKPTGRIVMRDVGDVMMVKEFHQLLRLEVPLLAKEGVDSVVSLRDFSIGAAFFDRMKPPAWAKEFLGEFFTSFEDNVKRGLESHGAPADAVHRALRESPAPDSHFKRYKLGGVSLTPFRRVARSLAHTIRPDALNECVVYAEVSAR